MASSVDTQLGRSELLPSDAGCLPAWQLGDLPEPRPFSVGNVFRTIGPGAILLAAAIGAGEWIAGPMTAITYGPGILWIATTAIVLQMCFNLEAIRYTMYTGEPILTGIMRLQPGPKLWAVLYGVLAILQLATPALAVGSAQVLWASLAGRMPQDTPRDARAVWLIATGILVLTVMLLLSGRSIERVLEKLSWAMIAFIFSFLVLANVLFVPGPHWQETLMGFLVPQALPANMDIQLLAVFAATAGSGGLGTLAISNWCRDKGFGMGAYMGGIGGVLAKDHAELAAVGHIFPANADNLRRWHTWWRYTLIDQSILWAGGCVLGMFLNVNLATSLVPAGHKLAGYEAGAFQAKYMAEQAWTGFWFLALINGFWILYSTHLGNTDTLVRTLTDLLWSANGRWRRWSASYLYAGLLAVISAWGLYSLWLGKNALELFKILGIVANPILAIGALQILRVNTRFLPKAVRPPWWRQLSLLACAGFYGAITVALVWDLLRQWD